MPKYLVTAEVKISLSTEVEAPTQEAARRIANERDLCSLSEPQETADEVWVHSGELDGTPYLLTVEEIE